MPIFACITIFVIIYIILMKFFKLNIKQNEGIASGECPECRKEIRQNWRYCPYCGTTKRKGDSIE